MSKVFLIIGKSYSGKDTLLNNILYDKEFCEEYNLERLVRYTTRKKRPNEKDGVDYYFINDNVYKENYELNIDAEDIGSKISITSFNSEFGYLHYITDFSKLDPSKNYIVTGDPDMIESYKKILGDNLCVIFLCPPNWVLFERFGLRNDNSKYSDKKYKEIYRRFIDDLIKFGKKSNQYLANCNCIVQIGKEYSLEMLKENMSKFLDENIHSVLVLLKEDEKSLICRNDYTPNTIVYPFDNLYDILQGEICLNNYHLMIYTEEASYEYSNK